MEFKLLFLGDIVGRPGRKILADRLSEIQNEYAVDITIANGENASGGSGIDPRTAGEIFSSGVDFITTGNHIWDRKEIKNYLVENSNKIIRPANYTKGAPGKGYAILEKNNFPKIAIVNLMGRVFMGELLDCPFQKIDSIIEEVDPSVDFTFLDFHAETTSEKIAMGFHLDGKMSMVVGTHTHVQTADLRLLPNGTAYITDVGMCGAYNSVIGMDVKGVLERFRTGLPSRFEPAKGVSQINAVVFTCSLEEKKVVSCDRILKIYE